MNLCLLFAAGSAFYASVFLAPISSAHSRQVITNPTTAAQFCVDRTITPWVIGHARQDGTCVGEMSQNPTKGAIAVALSMGASSPSVSDSSTTIDTTADSQNYLSHVANNAALAAWTNTAFPVERDGFATPGDGGLATYNWSSAACTAADSGSQITATAGGCWNIDWSSVKYEASPGLFENLFTATDDTAAIKAAVATGKTVYIPDITTIANRNWVVSSDIPQSVPAQIIHGDGRERSQLIMNFNSGFTKGVFVLAGSAGPTIRDIGFLFNQPNTSSLSSVVQYVPAVYSVNVPNTHIEHVSCFPAWDCFNMTGNAGQSTFDDIHFTAFHCGITLDGAQDSVRIKDPHFFPYGMGNNLHALYMMFPGQSGAPGQHGLCLGRVDDFKMTGGLFISGTAMDIHKSTYNASDHIGLSGEVSNTQFDVYSALTLTYGTISYSNIVSTNDTDGTHGLTSFVNSGGTLSINGGSHLQVNSLGTASVSKPGGGVLAAQSGISNIVGNFFDIGSADVTVVYQGSGHLNFDMNEITRNPNVAYPKNPLINLQGGDTIATANHTTNLGSGSGRYFFIGNDNGANRIFGNSGLGYTAYEPSSPRGIYGMNY